MNYSFIYALCVLLHITSATIQVFNNRAAFDLVVGDSPSVEDFNSLGAFTPGPGGSVVLPDNEAIQIGLLTLKSTTTGSKPGDWQIVAADFDNSNVGFLVPVDDTDFLRIGMRHRVDGFRSVTITFPQDVIAFGFDYHLTTGDTQFLFETSEDEVVVDAAKGSREFLGFVFSSPVQSVFLQETTGDGIIFWNMDNFVFEDDFCPTDPDKIFPGECGCEVADSDSDNDGFPDCFDAGEVDCRGLFCVLFK